MSYQRGIIESKDIINSEIFKSKENHAEQPLNILSDHQEFKIDEKFILKLTKDIESVSNEVKELCKVLHVTSEQNFNDLFGILSRLNSKNYPNLFVFVIEVKKFRFNENNSKKSEKIEEVILNFGATRPLLLQLTLVDENVSKFYYKEDVSSQFLDVEQHDENIAEIKDFPKLLSSFLCDKIESVNQIITAWQSILKSSLSMKFLKLFKNLFFKLTLEVAKSGTKADLLTILDAPVEYEGRVLSVEAQHYLSTVFYEEQSYNKSTNSSEIHSTHPFVFR